MHKFLFTLLTISLLWHQSLLAQRLCGFEFNKAALVAKDPSWAQKYEAHRASLQGIADNYKQKMKAGAAQRTTTASAIPVIFHFLIDSAQYTQLGGTAGIEQRVDSQIAVLNRDFNRENSDSVLIPYGWKPLYASAGIRFGLAHTNPDGYGTSGYDIKIIPSAPGGFSGAGSNYSGAKHNSTGGADAWDVTKYLNVWCINFVDIGGLLGLTTYKSITGGTGFPLDEEGICVSYATVGKRVSPTDYYIPTGYRTNYYDLGRTLTHEVGHFFEIWHTWGDDGGLCPWNGGSDDGIADTPPEGDAKYYAYPDTIPGGTYYDQCRHDGVTDTQQTLYGVATLDYMNYTDDIAMLMFTTDQAAVMAAQVAPGGENYSLTQNPDLLIYMYDTLVYGDQLPAGKSLNISPNPTTGIINITFDEATDALNQVRVINILGREVQSLNTNGLNKNYYSIDLSGMNKGIYFVRCNFASGTITRKILLQ